MADVFVDANVFLDVMRTRIGWQASAEVLNKVKRSEISGFISSITLSTLFYELKKTQPRGRAIEELKKALQGFRISNLSREDLAVMLLDDRMKDFEDLIQFYSAKKATSIIVTRNKHDFRSVSGEISVLTPEEYLATLSG